MIENTSVFWKYLWDKEQGVDTTTSPFAWNFTKKPTSIWASTQAKVTPEQLQSLGVNTADLDSQVEQKIQQSKDNEKTQDDFQNSFNEARASTKFTDLSNKEITLWLLQWYKSKWYTITWVDIDKELWIEKQTPTKWEEVQTKWQALRGATMDFTWKTLISIQEWVDNTIKAWLARLPTIWGEIRQFWWDTLANTVWKLWDALWADWWEAWIEKHAEDMVQELIENEEKVKDLFWVEEGSFWDKYGWTAAEFATLFIPWPKWVWLFDDIITKSPKLTKLLADSPKLVKWVDRLKTFMTGWKEAAKFWIVSEWETSVQDITIWWVANLWVQKVISKFHTEAWTLLRRVAWSKASQTKKLWTDVIDIDEGLAAEGISKLDPKFIAKVREGWDTFKWLMGLINGIESC